MQMSPVSSGNIKAVGYDPGTQQLHIEFTGGSYVFDNVPPKTYEAFMAASSKGSFFHSSIKGKHKHRLVSKAPAGQQ